MSKLVRKTVSPKTKSSLYLKTIKSTISPEVKINKGVTAKIIAGKIGKTEGPVKDLTVDVEYFYITMKPNSELVLKTKNGYSTFAYLIEGKLMSGKKEINERQLAIFLNGDSVSVKTKDKSARFIFASGKPLKEPVAWYGPIVMNTQEQLKQAFRELETNTFIKKK